MRPQTRREFFADVGKGMLIASVGSAIAADLGIATAFAEEGTERLTFGKLESLVGLMQETPLNQLLPTLVERLRGGTELRELVGAAALANARTFGGEDYVGFHTLMALPPAYHMARELPQARQALPVLKVLYRNSNRIQEKGGRANEVLHPVRPGPLPPGQLGGEALREAVRRKDMDEAERTFATLAQGSPEEAFNQLLYAVQDNTEVHRVVLPARAWELVGLIGQEQAHTLLRQSVRYCVRNEMHNRSQSRTLLPALLEQHQLLQRPLGTRTAEDGWVERMSQTLFRATPEQAAEAAAAALAEGMAPEAVGEAIALAANQLILRDVGRLANQTAPGKPVGSVHGDSIGVHACDSALAWRNMARASNPRNRAACLILAAYQVALDRINRGGDFSNWQPHPRPELLDEIKTTERAALLHEAENAIRNQDQARACAFVHRYGELGYPARPVFDLLLRYAISEEGALHAEKYYRTVTEEFAAMRPAFRWRQLTALARVTASEYGQPAAGYAEACQLLKV